MVTLSIDGENDDDTSPDVALSFTIGESSAAAALPRLGTCLTGGARPLAQHEVERLRALRLSQLRVDLNLSAPNYQESLRQAAIEAEALKLPLEVALALSNDAAAELRTLVEHLRTIKPKVGAWLIFHAHEKSTGERWVRIAREQLMAYDAAAVIGADTDANFAELNRARPPVELLGRVNYSLNPQVHASDDDTLIENLEAQRAMVESARQFFAALPITVGPITLKPRINPDAAAQQEQSHEAFELTEDERQFSLLGAGWTVGSIKQLAEGGADSLTYYEASGLRGVMETENGSTPRAQMLGLSGAVFPIYHVLADIGEFAGGDMIPGVSSEPHQLEGLVLSKDGRTRLILANLTPQPLALTIHNLTGDVRLRLLDEHSAQEAMFSVERFRAQRGELAQTIDGTMKLDLAPYAIARVDVTQEPTEARPRRKAEG